MHARMLTVPLLPRSPLHRLKKALQPASEDAAEFMASDNPGSLGVV